GNKETLKANPNAATTNPITNNLLLVKRLKAPLVISVRLVEPVVPYRKETPNKKKAEAKLPKIKYLNAASFGSTRSWLSAMSKYRVSEVSSRAIKVKIRSLEK